MALRPRLKLSPASAAEDEGRGRRPRRRPRPIGLTWSELVAALDENEADDAALERTLIARSTASASTPRPDPRRRLDEIARLYEGGDAAGAREAIHRLAPAGVRKLSRRIISDKLLRAQAERLIDRYTELLRGVARRGGEGLTAVGLLGSDSGRAFCCSTRPWPTSADAHAGGAGRALAHRRPSPSPAVKTEAVVVTVEIGEDGEAGRASAPYIHYGETADSVLAEIEAARGFIETGGDRAAMQTFMRPGAARNALDCALWEPAGQARGQERLGPWPAGAARSAEDRPTPEPGRSRRHGRTGAANAGRRS